MKENMKENRIKMVESILNNKDKIFKLSDVLSVLVTTMDAIDEADKDFNYDQSLNLIMCACYCLSKLDQKDFDECPMEKMILEDMENTLNEYNSGKGNS